MFCQSRMGSAGIAVGIHADFKDPRVKPRAKARREMSSFPYSPLSNSKMRSSRRALQRLGRELVLFDRLRRLAPNTILETCTDNPAGIAGAPGMAAL